MLLLVAAMTATAALPVPPPANPTAVIAVPSAVLLAKPDPDPAIIKMLQEDEGLRLKLYRDSRRNWTVGYGRNIGARGISEPEALYLLGNDIRACQVELDTHLPWWRLLSTPRQMAMLSLCYNLGIYGLKDFKAALKAMETGKYQDAARQFLRSRWAKQVGSRARRITELIDPQGKGSPTPAHHRR
jgi:lysozyme